PAVVLINTNIRRGQALGSGVIPDAEGTIITNNHVVPEDQGLTVILADGSEHDAFVLGRQPSQDLAVVRMVNPPEGLPVATLGDAAALQIGEPVAAIGAPFALRGTLTTGVISALNRVFPGNRDIPRIEGLIQTDAAINPGNSGGPLINAFGEVVGINTAIESPIQGSVGIGFAVPIETVRRVLAAIANRV
ncbi:MAG: S1C family serine protease, partial [Actinomycetota bacterium]